MHPYIASHSSSTTSHQTATLRVARVLALLLLCLSTLGAGAQAAQAAILTLNVDRTDDTALASGCQDAVPDDCSLRGAVLHANSVGPGDDIVIVLAAEVYELDIAGAAENGGWTGDLDILRDLELRGQGAEQTILMPGAGFDDRLLDIHVSLVVQIEDLQVAGFKPAASWHAVQFRTDADATVDGVLFRNNGTSTNGGGGLFLDSGVTGRVDNCDFVGNTASLDGGGGIRSLANQLAIRDSTFRKNRAASGAGGAIQLASPTLGTGVVEIERVVIEYNEAEIGGGIYSARLVEPTIIDSTLRYNDADDGGITGSGGALYTTGVVAIESSTFYGNTATAQGPAIHVEHDGIPGARIGTLNTTISGHRTPALLAAVSFDGADDSELIHTTFYDNDLDIYSNSTQVMHPQHSVFGSGCTYLGYDAVSSGGNVGTDDSCWSATPAAGDTVVPDLMLEDIGYYGGPTRTHLPKEGSPLLGPPPMCPPTDQRGYARPGIDCASGAVERLDPEPAIFADGFESGDTLRWTLTEPL